MRVQGINREPGSGIGAGGTGYMLAYDTPHLIAKKDKTKDSDENSHIKRFDKEKPTRIPRIQLYIPGKM